MATPEQLCQELNLLTAASQMPLTLQPGAALQEGGTGARSTPDDPVLRILAAGPRHIDEVAREAGLPVASVSSSLQLFELQGTVRQTAPMTYALA